MVRKLSIRLFVFLYAVLYTYPGKTAQFESYPWPQNQSSVVWKTNRTLFLFKKESISRINSEIDIRIENLANKSRQIHISILLNKFNYQEPYEEYFLSKKIFATKKPSIEFISSEITLPQWKALLIGQSHFIRGYIKTGAGTSPFSFQIRIAYSKENPFIEAVANTTFTHLKIDPPSLFYGLIVESENKVTLLSRLYFKDIKGLEEGFILVNPRSLHNDRAKSSKKPK